MMEWFPIEMQGSAYICGAVTFDADDPFLKSKRFDLPGAHKVRGSTYECPRCKESLLSLWDIKWHTTNHKDGTSSSGQTSQPYGFACAKCLQWSPMLVKPEPKKTTGTPPMPLFDGAYNDGDPKQKTQVQGYTQ
jgi:hypothetical protein